ncbi:MAG: hypothetical protein FJW37_14955 [Acidobacteria bacterium]|nr:hypothetical protein [Acidobacteriota bacterium]
MSLISFNPGLLFFFQQTRAETIEQEREAKSKTLRPDTLSRTEATLNYIRDRRIIERITGGVAGWRVRLGGLATGSGFALGPEYIRRDLAEGEITFRSSLRGSTRKFWLADLELDMPRLARDYYFLNLYAAHRYLPSLEYYGPGPDSVKTGRSNYLLENTSFSVRTGVRPVRYLRLEVTGHYLGINVGPGQDDRFASTEQVYSPLNTPGLRQQSNFLAGGAFAQYDHRDNPGGPRRGGNYLLEWTSYSDRDLGRHSFGVLHLELQQYIPFFNERRVIALRARTLWTDPHEGQVVPFYLQPVVGGSEDLRGYRAYRFYGDNSLVLNAEYRWEVFSGMDMAVFADAGKVYLSWRHTNFRDLESSVGFGLRFNVRNDVFMRIDTGFSHEGFQVWVKFNNVF